MVRTQPSTSTEPLPPPAKTLEARQDQLIALAYDLAEKRIRAETASAQETVHFLKLGSIRERLEQEKLRNEVEVLNGRVKEMESRKSSEELYLKALNAMRGYQGLEPEGEEGYETDVY